MKIHDIVSRSIKIRNGTDITEIYLTDLDEIADQYIRDMPEEDVLKTGTFLGILKEIYVEKFRPSTRQAYDSNSILISADPDEISALWDYYTQLAFRFQKTPTIRQFSLMTGLDRHTFTEWANGNARKASPKYGATAKKMLSESESALEAKTVENNGIGAIFALKACHNWRETSPASPEEIGMIQHDSAEQIAERHKYATLPDKPDIFD